MPNNPNPLININAIANGLQNDATPVNANLVGINTTGNLTIDLVNSLERQLGAVSVGKNCVGAYYGSCTTTSVLISPVIGRFGFTVSGSSVSAVVDTNVNTFGFTGVTTLTSANILKSGNLAGTVAGTVGTTTITLSGGSFSGIFQVGDTISVGTRGYRVAAVSATSITTTRPLATSFAFSAYQRGGLCTVGFQTYLPYVIGQYSGGTVTPQLVLSSRDTGVGTNAPDILVDLTSGFSAFLRLPSQIITSGGDFVVSAFKNQETTYGGFMVSNIPHGSIPGTFTAIPATNELFTRTTVLAEVNATCINTNLPTQGGYPGGYSIGANAGGSFSQFGFMGPLVIPVTPGAGLFHAVPPTGGGSTTLFLRKVLVGP